MQTTYMIKGLESWYMHAIQGMIHQRITVSQLVQAHLSMCRPRPKFKPGGVFASAVVAEVGPELVSLKDGSLVPVPRIQPIPEQAMQRINRIEGIKDSIINQAMSIEEEVKRIKWKGRR